MTLDLDADLSGLSVGDRATATANEILRVEVGSTAHGISVGNDDLDLMAVYLQTPEQLLGIAEHVDHYVGRTQRRRLRGLQPAQVPAVGDLGKPDGARRPLRLDGARVDPAR